MKKAFSFKYSIETLGVVLAIALLGNVLYQFAVGKHFIIPTLILVPALFIGNLARWGYRDEPWAKHVNFWFGVLLTAHWFFAFFYSQTLKAMLGAAFEPVAGIICLLLGYLTLMYKRHNHLTL